MNQVNEKYFISKIASRLNCSADEVKKLKIINTRTYESLFRNFLSEISHQ